MQNCDWIGQPIVGLVSEWTDWFQIRICVCAYVIWNELIDV